MRNRLILDLKRHRGNLARLLPETQRAAQVSKLIFDSEAT